MPTPNTLTFEEMRDRHSRGVRGRDKKPYDGAQVKMYMDTVEKKDESLRERRPIHVDVPSISIQYPGMDETVRRIEERDQADYPELYAAFLAANGGEVEEPLKGTPLKEWSMMPRAIMAELAYFKFRTVDQLANANGATIKKLGPLSVWVKRAKEWISSADSTASEMVSLREQMERLEKKCAALENQNSLLIQRVEASEGVRLSK